ncbi:MAG: AAA family ATPase [Clostridia bacterium]
MKINRLEIENVKRVKAVRLEPAQNGLTVIGGRNGQGKTSVLDAIAWALGGERYRPTQAQRDGSVLPPDIHIVMDNGLVVERKGKNSALKVIDPNGQQSGQQLLNGFVEQLALDLPRFMRASSGEKAATLLKIIGVGGQLQQLETDEKRAYNERLVIGRIAEQKGAFAKECPYFPDAPSDIVSASDLIRAQQDILMRNGENQRKRERLAQLEAESVRVNAELSELMQLTSALKSDLELARKSALDLHDESTEALKRNIEDVEEINRKVRANLDRDKATDDARLYTEQYNALSIAIDDIRAQKSKLLLGAPLPLPGLTVDDGSLFYNGYAWDNLSGADQLRVATAIVRKLNPQCGFVLLDKLEQMDIDTLREFGAWLEGEGLQAIATRVSTGSECAIVIEDGYASEAGASIQPTWKAGAF